MNLIFLYGPPGVGKLTVAKELAKITGYDVFHNHLTADLARSIFQFGTEEYSRLVEKIRLDLFEAAAASGKEGLIFTFVYGVETYGGREDDVFVKKVVDAAAKHDGQVLFVKLACETDELHKRLKAPGRKSFRKLTSVKELRAIRKQYDVDSVIPFGESLTIDNTRLTAAKVAGMIKKHYRL